MVLYRYIGQGETNSNGVASINYTGIGKGKMEVVASTDRPIVDGSLQSVTYSILDCIFYDEATSSATKNPNWNSSNISVNYENGYCVLSKTSTGTGNYTVGATLTSAFIVEWHNYLESDGNNYFMLNNNNYLSLSDVNGDCSVKLIVESDKITLIINGETKTPKTINVDLSQGVSPILRIHNASSHNIGYTNFKIYPL